MRGTRAPFSLSTPLALPAVTPDTPAEPSGPAATRRRPRSPSASPKPAKHPRLSIMGPTRHANGSSNSNGNSNGVAHGAAHPGDWAAETPGEPSRLVPRRVKADGALMYEDDSAWVGDDPAGTGRMPVLREEAVRIVLQALKDMGYNQAADTLEAESGFVLASRASADFQAAILGGRWAEAIALLAEIGVAPVPAPTPSDGPAEPQPASSSSSAASLCPPTPAGNDGPAYRARFLIAQQKYLEYLEAGQQGKALRVLRHELAQSASDSDALHTLSSYMMCLDKADLHERARWDGAAGGSRAALLEQLQHHVSPGAIVPARRLATLLDHARRHQQRGCMYHDAPEAGSLLADHGCRAGQFPNTTTHILGDHADEVWRVEWSPDGALLASAGKDRRVVIWRITETAKDGHVRYDVEALHHLDEHGAAVDALAWSPDGKTLVTASEKQLYIWDVATGRRRHTQLGASQHGDTISTVQWRPDGSEFLVSSLDCKLIFYNPLGNVVRSWQFSSAQLIDFVVHPDNQRLVALTTSLRRVPVGDKLKPTLSARVQEVTESMPTPNGYQDMTYLNMEHGLAVIRIADRLIIDYMADLGRDVTSLKLSADGTKVLVSCAPDEIQVLGLEPGLHALRSYRGHEQNRFLIRSCFGGTKDRFVLSGSEDGHVYVWQAGASEPVEILSGHMDTVNAVAWNPVATRRLFVSCGDDGEVRVWQPPAPADDDGYADSAGAAEGDGIVL
ncbi:hypothetical protein Q5752_005480 [Cryptotrichosporon argae]